MGNPGKLALVVYGLLMGINSLAQEKKPADVGLGDAATNAVNPGAFVTKLQVQPNFTWKEDKARQINLTTRIVQPSASLLLPFIKSKNPKKVYTIYRLELPLLSQTFPKSPRLDGTGLSDLVLLDLAVFKKSWGLFGAGPGLIIPTVKPETVSAGKWCVGPTLFAVNMKTKGLLYGLSVQQFFSFAGSSQKPSRSFMLLNPIFNKILSHGYFVSCSPFLTIDWENNTYSVPITASLGRAFAKNMSMFIAPQYMLSGPNRGDFTLQFQINLMFATK